ncbi:MAG TPA: hypothetical protein PK992_19735, partial [Planctomycetaceae bacterium]|nr:hypothetical protein [Planctomycetaceae bacterium]
RSPQRRYASAGALAEDLNRFLTGAPVLARQTPLLVRIQKWCRQRPGVSRLLAVSVFLFITLVISAIRYTSSLQSLQGRLQNSNADLKKHVTELGVAVQSANSIRAAAEEGRLKSERLLFASDVHLAGSILKRGDFREAVRILRRYAANSVEFESVNGEDSFAWRYLWNRSTQLSQELFKSEQPVWWLQPSPDGQQLVLCGGGGVLHVLDAHDGLTLEKTLCPTEQDLNCGGCRRFRRCRQSTSCRGKACTAFCFCRAHISCLSAGTHPASRCGTPTRQKKSGRSIWFMKA